MRITVIVATINRALQLRDFTLNSLFSQSNKEFDVIVWDASKNDETKEICDIYGKKINYVHAPRTGLAKQRNDAVDYALSAFPDNEIVLFLDDDVILSCNAIEGLKNTYQDDKEVFCVGIPISGIVRKNSFIKTIAKSVFLNFEYKKRRVTDYGYVYYPSSENNSDIVNWLSGCGMSYRKQCFDTARFDERLCLFGGYSLGEDVLFSVALFKKGFKTKLSDKGCLIHKRDSSSRLDYKKWVASLVYNHYLLFLELNTHNSKIKKVINYILFSWNQFYNLSILFLKSLKEKTSGDFFKGLKEGRIAKRRAQ